MIVIFEVGYSVSLMLHTEKDLEETKQKMAVESTELVLGQKKMPQ